MNPRIKAWLRLAHRFFCTWFFGDVIFVIIPLAVIALIYGLLGRGFEDFFRVKEWSFGSIVLFGVSIRQFMKLKIEVQRTPTSYKLDSGIQLIIVGLIASVIALSFTILAELKALPDHLYHGIAVAQITAFCFGLFFTLLAPIGMEVVRLRESVPSNIGKNWVLGRLVHRADNLVSDTSTFLYIVSKLSTAILKVPTDALRAELEERRLLNEINHKLSRAEETLASIRAHIAHFHPDPNLPQEESRAAR